MNPYGKLADADNSADWSEATEGLCPVCLQRVPARLWEEDGQVWIGQECLRHGPNRALIAANAAEYLRLRRYVPERAAGGSCCGPGESCDGPPTCVLLLEITTACNLTCPTCYADAHGHDMMPIAEVKRRLDLFFQGQARLDVLMLSGGEPTIHPQFAEILELSLQYPIERVLINTNGLRLTQSTELVRTLAQHREQIELYFSLSSFAEAGHLHFYGRDLRREKEQALDKAREAELFVNLVAVVETGVNDAEIGDLFRFALSRTEIAGLVFQPVMDTGRNLNAYEPQKRMTMTGVLAELERQTDGHLLSSDFAGLPCSHPDCCALTYGFLNHERTVLTPLTRHLDVARYLELFSDRISFSGLVGSALKRVWSDMTHLRAGRTLHDLAALFSASGIRESLPLVGRPVQFGRRVFRVIVKPFMDAQTYDRKRIDECCTKILDERGEAVSFCAYNIARRGRAAKPGTVPLKIIV